MAKRVELDNLPSDTVLFISAAITINCPAQHAFNTLTDTATWPEWNTFCPEIELDSKTKRLSEGQHIILGVHMKSGESLYRQKVIVSDFVAPGNPSTSPKTSGAPFRICWQTEGMPRFMLRGERVNEFYEVESASGEVQCEYKTWEGLAGPMAHIVKRMYGELLQSRFEDWARDLKGYAEMTWQAKSVDRDNEPIG